MPKLNEVYKCEVCGNIVEVLHAGPAALTCCNQKMTLMTETTVDAAVETHVPMQDDHYIEWIELLADGKVYRQNLQPGDAPEAVFPVIAQAVTAREYCNLHGHWSAQS